MIAHQPTAPHPLPPVTHQLPLPLSQTQAPTAIAPQEVWQGLTPEQQTRFFRQLVRLCCQLARPSQRQEGRDE